MDSNKMSGCEIEMMNLQFAPYAKMLASYTRKKWPKHDPPFKALKAAESELAKVIQTIPPMPPKPVTPPGGWPENMKAHST